MILTKSDFLLYLDAPLHLWAKINHRQDTREFSAFDQHLARQGYQVERLAKKFLKQHIEQNYNQAELDFQAVLKSGSYQSRIDALVYDQQDQVYDLFEIKSSNRIKKEHKYDVTFQYLVAKGCDKPVRNIYLVYINKDYKKQCQLDLNQFFLVKDMAKTVSKYEDEVFQERSKALKILSLTEDEINLDVDLDLNCHKPNECPCLSICHPNLSDYPIYDLARGTRRKFNKLKQRQVARVDQIPADFNLTGKQRLQVKSAKNQEPIIDQEAIKKELDSLQYPLYFLDYETFNPAMPIFDNYKPYQQITFQYSLHVLNKPTNQLSGLPADEEFEHFEFLFTEQSDPGYELVKSLTENIGNQGSIIVWKKGFECGRNEELAELQPQFAHKLLDINNRVYDLMEIFSKGLYVDYHFHGSASIKKVLPVLVPELSYSGMEIGEGATAMIRWFELVYGDGQGNLLSQEERNQIANNLLKYCELDTWAMVRIWERLREKVR
ncbi:MAG: DUF2779 domain-containing protein [Candidatus Pacebacteria bacterium]|nr:DUF2779 domain-containing protein [Candidatus Paceibacterota bacterium]